jgi:hypothetical protein
MPDYLAMVDEILVRGEGPLTRYETECLTEIERRLRGGEALGETAVHQLEQMYVAHVPVWRRKHGAGTTKS